MALVCDMALSSDYWNAKSSPPDPVYVRYAGTDVSYYCAMALPIRHDWFLQAWMDHFHLEQTDIRAKTGWSKRKASDLCTGAQRYNRDVLNDLAGALHLAPYELLMHPDDAYAIRNMRAAIEKEAIRLVADRGPVYEAPPPEDEARRAHG